MEGEYGAARYWCLRRLLALAALLSVPGVIGCTDDMGRPTPSGSMCTLEPDADRCDTCIVLNRVARLGTDWMGPGYLRNDGTMEFVVRDSMGHYWVGQRDEIKRYDRDGRFLGSVGRFGEGPMEFKRARPFHVDSMGRVHVQDSGNGRITAIDPSSLLLAKEISIPRVVVNSAIALNDGKQYGIQGWIPEADRIGFPIHVVSEQGVVASFGIRTSSDEDEMIQHTPRTTERRLAIDQQGIIYSAHRYEYEIESWSLDGELLSDLKVLEELNPENHFDEAVSPDNPPPQVIVEIHVDADRMLWVLLAVRDEDWLDHMVEVATQDGVVRFVPREGRDGVFDLYDVRVDVIDLAQCQLVASQVTDLFFGAFVEDGLVSSAAVGTGGGDVLEIWELSLKR